MAKRRGTKEELSQIVDGVAHIHVTLRDGTTHTIKLDEADLGIWSAHTWGIFHDGKGHYYVARGVRANGKVKTIYLHRELLEAPKALQVDHINRDTLDLRRVNLRLATNAQNSANAKVQKNSTSGVTGVGWYPKASKWRAHITLGGRFILLGLFHSFGAAVNARREAERHFFGAFAPSQRAA